ncbi:hypothetical protein [Cysteiniphilum halobium]|uniref:hypothetical protein n=1 Tax=Cysteiniphilum halobium TaxID=2219059 RepID=UPI003F862C08
MSANLKSGKSAVLKLPRNVLGCDVYVCARRLNTGGLLILVSDYHGEVVINTSKIMASIKLEFELKLTKIQIEKLLSVL